MPARKIHDSSVGPSLTIPVCCDRTALWKGTLPDRKPLTSTAPSHVTCLRCLRTLARLTRARGAPQAGAGGMTAEGGGEAHRCHKLSDMGMV
jgi:hypothetical protein